LQEEKAPLVSHQQKNFKAKKKKTLTKTLIPEPFRMTASPSASEDRSKTLKSYIKKTGATGRPFGYKK